MERGECLLLVQLVLLGLAAAQFQSPQLQQQQLPDAFQLVQQHLGGRTQFQQQPQRLAPPRVLPQPQLQPQQLQPLQGFGQPTKSAMSPAGSTMTFTAGTETFQQINTRAQPSQPSLPSAVPVATRTFADSAQPSVFQPQRAAAFAPVEFANAVPAPVQQHDAQVFQRRPPPPAPQISTPTRFQQDTQQFSQDAPRFQQSRQSFQQDAARLQQNTQQFQQDTPRLQQNTQQFQQDTLRLHQNTQQFQQDTPRFQEAHQFQQQDELATPQSFDVILPQTSSFQSQRETDLRTATRTSSVRAQSRRPSAPPAAPTVSSLPQPVDTASTTSTTSTRQGAPLRTNPIRVLDEQGNPQEDELFREQAQNAKYTFASAVDDKLTDNSQVRQETRDGLNLSGLYSYSDGFFKRTVHYEADQNGYRVTKEDVEPIGDGPRPDPDGNAEVAASISGMDYRYRITADDIRDRSKEEKTRLQQQQQQQQQQLRRQLDERP